jgi:hypothetical protein
MEWFTGLLFAWNSFRSLMFQDASLPFLFQTSPFRRLAESRLLSDFSLLQSRAQQFHETLDSSLSIDHLASSLLRYDAQYTILADSAPEAAHDEFFFFRRKARRVGCIEPKGNSGVYLVDILPARSAAEGCGKLELFFGNGDSVRHFYHFGKSSTSNPLRRGALNLGRQKILEFL